MMSSAENDPRPAGTIWMLNLDEAVPVVQPLISAAFRRLTPDLLLELADSNLASSSAEILRRLNAGKYCYAAWIEDRLAAYGWVSFVEEHIGELNLRIKLLPGEVYIWDCATAPEFRGKHLYSSLLSHIIQELHAEGFCRAWIGTDLDNVASQKGIARAGFRHVANLAIERVLAIRQVWVQGLPNVPEQIVSEARRAFLNDRGKIWLNAPSSLTQS
jgi:ribosomal protein S18 acetylase RimI-like enzyme